MQKDYLKSHIKTLEYAFKSAIDTGEEGLKWLNKNTDKKNVMYQRDTIGNDELNKNTLKASQYITATILICFLIELIIKLILLERTGKKEKGHNLFDLFSLLPLDIQSQIKTLYPKSDEDFDEILKNNKSGFIDWRYAPEFKSKKKSDIGFLDALFHALKKHTDID